MTRIAGWAAIAATLLLGGALLGAAPAAAQDGTMAMDEYIRTVCNGHESCQAEGTKALQNKQHLLVVLAAMCHQLPRSTMEGECFETGYGLVGVLKPEALQITVDALDTNRDALVRFITHIHDDCGRRNECYWIRMMGFEREYKNYEKAGAE
jgi:hypothetical protein